MNARKGSGCHFNLSYRFQISLSKTGAQRFWTLRAMEDQIYLFKQIKYTIGTNLSVRTDTGLVRQSLSHLMRMSVQSASLLMQRNQFILLTVPVLSWMM